MSHPKFTPLELQIMQALWTKGACSVREIHESFPDLARPAFTTVQTTIYRLEAKRALRRVKRISNANIFEAVASRRDAQTRIVNDLLAFFGGKMSTVMTHLVETGRVTLDDIEDAEKALRQLKRKKGRSQ